MTAFSPAFTGLIDATEPPEARGLTGDAALSHDSVLTGDTPLSDDSALSDDSVLSDDSALSRGSVPTRESVRLLVGRRTGSVSHHTFADLPSQLDTGDVLVVNTSATLPAAVSIPDSGLTVHFSTERADGRWLVELRHGSAAGKGTRPYSGGAVSQRYVLPGGGWLRLDEPYSIGRLWVATVATGGLDRLDYLYRYGAPIRYPYVTKAWPLSAYQTVFARHPGSAEMPSAGRPFTDRMVTRLVTAGVLVVPILLHTGVASPEAHERPYPERFAVPGPTARVITAARAAGGRIVAVGTTVVRALESAVDPDGRLRAASGITDLVVTPQRGVRIVDGLLTGFHEPTASHHDLLAAVAGTELVAACYAQAAATGYRWHEFGDVNLLLP